MNNQATFGSYKQASETTQNIFTNGYGFVNDTIDRVRLSLGRSAGQSQDSTFRFKKLNFSEEPIIIRRKPSKAHPSIKGK